MKLALLALACLGLLLMGCSDTKTTATPEEQNRYQNPIKEPPPEAGGPPPSPKGAGK